MSELSDPPFVLPGSWPSLGGVSGSFRSNWRVGVCRLYPVMLVMQSIEEG